VRRGTIARIGAILAALSVVRGGLNVGCMADRVSVGASGNARRFRRPRMPERADGLYRVQEPRPQEIGLNPNRSALVRI